MLLSLLTPAWRVAGQLYVLLHLIQAGRGQGGLETAPAGINHADSNIANISASSYAVIQGCSLFNDAFSVIHAIQCRM
jgi:hypothetical protein